MTIQATSLESKLDTLEQKAEEYDTRTNTEQRVARSEENLQELNQVLSKLESSFSEFEQQAGVLTEVLDQSLPSTAVHARDQVRSITSVTQDDILDIIDDSSQSLSSHIDDIRETRETVKTAIDRINDELRKIRREKLEDADTAESIQKIDGENLDARETIESYRSFLNSLLNPKAPISELKSRWQGIEKAFENLDTDWEGFRQRHDLSHQTIEDLKTLSRDGEVDLDELSDSSVNEMLDVSELRSNIKMSL